MSILKLDPDEPLEPAPGKTALDHGLAVAKAASVLLPFLGPSVALFDLITAPSRGKRFSAWCEELRLGFNDLSQKINVLAASRVATVGTTPTPPVAAVPPPSAKLDPEVLAQDEAFISALAQAS